MAILVNSKDPELALPFNMPVVTYQIGSTTSGQQRLLGYLVDQNGDIDFPILGRLHQKLHYNKPPKADTLAKKQKAVQAIANYGQAKTGFSDFYYHDHRW